MSLKEDLQGRIQGEVIDDLERRKELSGDFGRMVFKTPALLIRPRGKEDIVATVTFAREKRLAVGIRGNAHTQSGQGLTDGGLLLDMTSLNKILSIEPLKRHAVCESGVKWKTLVEETLRQGLIPPVLTNNLDVTVGGTLSVAGLGVASFRFGAQGDNCVELEVVTGKGEIVTCSPEKEAELFYCSLAGLGRFGIITKAVLILRKVISQTRTYYLLYDKLSTLMKDAEQLMREDRFAFLESWCVPAPQGFKKVGGIPTPFARWFFPLHATVEFDPASPPDETKLLKGLSFYEKIHQEDRSLLEFANRLEPLFALWKQAGYWANPHPWMETILPWQSAEPFIQQVLTNLPPHLLGGGHILLWPSKGTASRLPLFKTPSSEWVMGFGILPGIPREGIDRTVAMLNQLSDLSMQTGGKRYLSGLIQFDGARWKSHYGEVWEKMKAWKKTYDPDGILNPGFINWSA